MARGEHSMEKTGIKVKSFKSFGMHEFGSASQCKVEQLVVSYLNTLV